tara:strand:- start:1694 stop:1870 length:177 start_codon:yes stop_codon:yes gene_type:complete
MAKIYKSYNDYEITHITLEKKDMENLRKGEDIIAEVSGDEGKLIHILTGDEYYGKENK